MLKSKQQGANLKLWSYDPNKNKTRGFSLEPKVSRKEPLDSGINSKKKDLQLGKKDLPSKLKHDSRKPPYDVKEHFNAVAKACHSVEAALKKSSLTSPQKQIKKKLVKKSNNVRIDDEKIGKRKYLVPNIKDLR